MTEEVKSSISKISQIHSITADFLTQKLTEKGFNDFASSHGNILFQLNLHKTMKMSELAQKINRDKSTTTVLVRKLENEGLIQINSDQNDKRNKIISLTEKGTEYNNLTSELSEALLSTFYKDFSDQEMIEFCSYLERIKNNFKNN